jgi:hypothetical protein
MWHKGKRHNYICLKPERGRKELGIIVYFPNRKGAKTERGMKERGINGKRQNGFCIIEYLLNWKGAKTQRGRKERGKNRKRQNEKKPKEIWHNHLSVNPESGINGKWQKRKEA